MRLLMRLLWCCGGYGGLKVDGHQCDIVHCVINICFDCVRSLDIYSTSTIILAQAHGRAYVVRDNKYTPPSARKLGTDLGPAHDDRHLLNQSRNNDAAGFIQFFFSPVQNVGLPPPLPSPTISTLSPDELPRTQRKRQAERLFG